jgi:ribosomal protection tetracycline resistance protein
MSSTGEDFRKLTPLVVMTALRRAGTIVCEPIHRFELDAPADSLATLLSALTRLQAVPRTQDVGARAVRLAGDIPAAFVHELRQRLPSLTRGEAVVETHFDRYEPVRDAVPPTRPRTDTNPLDRVEYLRRVAWHANTPRERTS